jgi:predicted nucleic acid-binding protein
VSHERIIVDAGPLVAILNRRDSQHAVCHKQSLDLARPFLTTWPVVAEAAWLLRHTDGGVSQLLGLISDGLLHCYPLGVDAAGWMDGFLKKYADQSPQLADASLMYVAEHENVASIFTLDRRDFLIFRLSNNRPLKLRPET